MSVEIGTLHVEIPGLPGIPVPIIVRDRSLSVVTTITPREEVSLPAGQYVLDAYIPSDLSGSTIIAVEGGVTTFVTLGAEEPDAAAVPLMPRAEDFRWTLDYVALTHERRPALPDVEVQRLESSDWGSSYASLFVPPARDDAEYIILNNPRSDPILIPLPTMPTSESRRTGSVIDIFAAGPGAVDVNVTAGGTPEAQYVTRLLDAGQLQNALRLMASLEEQGHLEPIVQCLFAYTLLRVGRWDEAKRATEQAMRNDIGSDALVARAQWARRTGDTESASELFVRALKSGPPVLSDGISYLAAVDDGMLPDLDDDAKQRLRALRVLATTSSLSNVVPQTTAPMGEIDDILRGLGGEQFGYAGPDQTRRRRREVVADVPWHYAPRSFFEFTGDAVRGAIRNATNVFGDRDRGRSPTDPGPPATPV